MTAATGPPSYTRPMATKLRRAWRTHLRADGSCGPAPAVTTCSLPGATLLATGHRLPHYCTPLDHVDWVPAAAARDVGPDDTVLCYRSGGRAWAVPWFVMKNHHVANLVLDDVPTLLTLCENCAAGGAWDPHVDGRLLRFQVEGVYKGTPLMSDDVTGSVWSLVLGRCVEGPMTGTELRRFPVVQTTWAIWRAAEPATLVHGGRGEPRTGHGAALTSPDVSDRAVVGRVDVDDLLPAPTLVASVEADGLAAAYPIDVLRAAGGVVNDVVGGTPVAVVLALEPWGAVAFDRRAGAELLQLRRAAAGLEDVSSGSTWTSDGRAIGGPLATEDLAYVRSGIEKWAAWASNHPGGSLRAAP